MKSEMCGSIDRLEIDRLEWEREIKADSSEEFLETKTRFKDLTELVSSDETIMMGDQLLGHPDISKLLFKTSIELKTETLSDLSDNSLLNIIEEATKELSRRTHS